MPGRADIEIVTSHGRPLAFVQVKNLPRLSRETAVGLRDALVQDVPIQYVLVLSQNAGFVWRRQGDQVEYREPEVLDMRPVLREYFSEGELSRHMRGTELELVFSHWLGDLARGRVTRPGGTAGHGPFAQFVTDIRDAQIRIEALA